MRSEFDVHFKLIIESVTLVPEAICKERGAMERGRGAKQGRGKPPLVESVGNLTSMLSPSTEIEPRR